MFAFAFGIAFGAELGPAFDTLGAGGTSGGLDAALFAAPAVALDDLEAENDHKSVSLDVVKCLPS